MSRPELSISFRAEQKESVLQTTAEAAGRYGFDVISVYEDLGDPSPMYPLFTFAKHSQEARVGPACIAVPRHATMEPVVADISKLDNLRPGQAYLGIAPGAWMEKIGLKQATVQQMREAAEVSSYLLEKRENGYSGQYYTVQPGFTVNYETPREKVPLLIGAWGENMAALAGEIADEIKIGGSANPLMIDIIKRRVAVGAARKGRSVDDVGIVLGAVTVVDNDREKALYVARQKAAIYIDAIGDKDPTVSADYPDEIDFVKRAIAVGDVENAAHFMPEALVKRFVFAGTPEDIIRQVEDAFAAGASRVEFGTPHGINEVEGIDLLGKKVLPYFR